MAACSGSRPSTEGPILLPALPAGLRQACAHPVPLPATPLTQREVETLWAADRAALVRCGLSLGALVTYYQALAATLGAAEQS